jgi:hypothetical protein
MAFTYDFNIKRDIARVRLSLGDTVQDSGVLPDGKNFQDSEIEAVLADCNNDVDAATFVFLKGLSNAWGTYVDITVGPRKEGLSDVSFHYAKRAAEMGARTGLSAKSFSVALKRIDGYSEEADD